MQYVMREFNILDVYFQHYEQIKWLNQGILKSHE
jgi:hypothetical protein